MKSTLNNVVAGAASLALLAKTSTPPSVEFDIATLVKAVSVHAQTATETRNKWITELGADDKIDAASPNWAEFVKRCEELGAKEVELPGVEPITIDQLGDKALTYLVDGKEVKYTAEDLAPLVGVFVVRVPAKAA